jgi:signal transduction histidine kinase
MRSVQLVFSFLARRRWAAVGLALVVESGILVPLAYADPSAVVGIPAAIAAGVAGTVAVVFGPLDGAAVALGGALAFGVPGGWGPGELAALGVWPAIVGAAGLFARHLLRHRAAFRHVVEAQEVERQRLALELHDETAQTLAAALMALGRVERASTRPDAAEATEGLRQLVTDALENVRDLAVHLRPKALDDFGLAPALERLTASFAERTGIPVDLELATAVRLPAETELVLYRVAQEALDRVAKLPEGAAVRIALEQSPGMVTLLVHSDGRSFDTVGTSHGPGLAGLDHRVQLLGGRLTVATQEGAPTLRATIPLR